VRPLIFIFLSLCFFAFSNFANDQNKFLTIEHSADVRGSGSLIGDTWTAVTFETVLFQAIEGTFARRPQLGNYRMWRKQLLAKPNINDGECSKD
jgi:hypothetical protein